MDTPHENSNNQVAAFLRFHKGLIIESTFCIFYTLFFTLAVPLKLGLPEGMALLFIMARLSLCNSVILFISPVIGQATSRVKFQVERRKRVLLLQILVIIGVQLLVVSLFYSFPNYQAVLLLLLWSMIGKGFGIFCGKLARVWNPWVILVLGEIILIVAGLNLISGWDLRDIAQRILEMKAKGSQF